MLSMEGLLAARAALLPLCLGLCLGLTLACAAGAAPPSPWICADPGARPRGRGPSPRAVDPRGLCAPAGELFLCADPDPDTPEGAAPGAWRCRYDNSGK